MAPLHHPHSTFWKRSALAAVLMCSLALAGCKTEVYQGLTEAQANAMMAVLLKNGIDSEKQSEGKNGFTLKVDDRHVATTLELMRENNLPRPAHDTMGDVFAAKGMISSATEEQARLTYALSQELSETFSQIDGVLTARVHVVLAHVDLGTGTSTPASAAVFLRHTPDSQAPNLVASIQQLTANAVPGLDKAKVSVMLVPVRETVTVPMLADPARRDDRLVYGVLGAALLAAAGVAGAIIMRRRRSAPTESDAAQD